MCGPNNEPCSSVTSSSLCEFDMQLDKGTCTESNAACLFDFAACEAAGGTTCADGICLDADGQDLFVACTDGCADANDFCEQTRQFRLVFTPDVKNWVGYKLNASNPGQTFYNLFYEGDPGDNVTLQITVPYPYVTVGATPVHVYDGDLVEVTDADPSCDGQQFVPPEEALAESHVQLSIEDWIDGGVNNVEVTCEEVCVPDGTSTAPPKVFCTFSVEVTIPDSGIVYVNAHLDYGLKGPRLDAYPCGDASYDRGASASVWSSYDALVNTSPDGSGDLAIADCQDYSFSHTDDVPGGLPIDGDSVQNLNKFKRISGAFGLVQASATSSAIDGAQLLLVRQDSGEVVQTAETDEDGAYLLLYKHKGKPALYNVFLLGETEDLVQEIELQGNGWVEVMFDVDTWTTTVEYGSGRNKNKSKR